MRNVISYFSKDDFLSASEIFSRGSNISYSGAGNSSSKAMLLSDIMRQGDFSEGKMPSVGNVLWIVGDVNEQHVVQKAMEMWSGRKVFLYKRRGDEERLSFATSREFDERRNMELIEFATRVKENDRAVFVLDFETILQDFPDVEIMKRESYEVVVGADLDPVDFVGKLVGMGYEITDDDRVRKGQYLRVGDSLSVWPVNDEKPVRVDMDFDKVEAIFCEEKKRESLRIYPLDFDSTVEDVLDLFNEEDVVVDDEVDVVDEHYDVWNRFMEKAANGCKTISFSSFNDDVSHHKHLHFLSVLKYRGGYDFANDMRDKISAGWKILFFTKHFDEVRGLFRDQKVPFQHGIDGENFGNSSVFLIDIDKEDTFPQSFQSPQVNIAILNDTDLLFLKDSRGKKSVSQNVFNDFLTSLNFGDYVVHADHGIAKFLGLEKKTVEEVTKEYLKLGYAENDKLFVPIDQADKVNKYIGSEDLMPKLTRLGSAEWNTITSKVKKETQKIAKELLKLYAERKAAKGYKFKKGEDLMKKFEDTFPYEETPGQIKAIEDVKGDMESEITMDRLICGDVGFGKTEVAMRAAFKAVLSGKQVAVVSPITILADQHYKSFSKRMADFNVRIDMMSRFRSQKQMKEILEKTKKGELDIVVGTHRLLQPDVDFKNLGLVIIDEEQRFGVKQKEKLKEMRKEVDILTLTATPIPRTLNICLNKLRDITTITTPPFGRLPVITEVRKYSPSLVREAILKETERGGQVYFLHNRVQTIDSFADKLRELVPEVRFGVAHGKLGAGDLEERIMAFKEGRFDVLVSSTIVENGIDLANANTLIVNNAERFGLSQLYQLRGRVGRGKRQAYAYFLYQGQRLKLDAKKRLRAIVEASELGSGFQIAMKDLEIRGAGDILGANQHGVINVVGMSHFMRMLNKAVEDLKAGRVMEGEEEVSDVSVELPVPAYIPDSYIPDSKDKINVYQKLSSADNVDYLEEVREEILDDFGKMPMEVNNLFKIIELKVYAKEAGVVNVKAEAVPMSKDKEIVLHMSGNVKPANIVSLLEYNPSWRIVGSRLRINMRELGRGGKHWFDELFKNVEALGRAKEHGK